MYVHTGEWPHSCEICKKQFVYADQLKTHMARHDGETYLLTM